MIIDLNLITTLNQYNFYGLLITFSHNRTDFLLLFSVAKVIYFL